MREIGEVRRRGVFAVYVEPYQTFGADRAAEDFGEVERVDVGEAGADEREGGIEVCGAEGCSRVIWRGGVDGVGFDGCGDGSSGRGKIGHIEV